MNQRLKEILTCQYCGKPFKKLDKYAYKPDCDCFGKERNIRISVG